MNLPPPLTTSAPILLEYLPLPDRYPETSRFSAFGAPAGRMHCHIRRSSFLPKQPEATPTL